MSGEDLLDESIFLLIVIAKKHVLALAIEFDKSHVLVGADVYIDFGFSDCATG